MKYNVIFFHYSIVNARLFNKPLCIITLWWFYFGTFLSINALRSYKTKVYLRAYSQLEWKVFKILLSHNVSLIYLHHESWPILERVYAFQFSPRHGPRVAPLTNVGFFFQNGNWKAPTYFISLVWTIGCDDFLNVFVKISI